jgi:hypothetical protein
LETSGKMLAQTIIPGIPLSIFSLKDTLVIITLHFQSLLCKIKHILICLDLTITFEKDEPKTVVDKFPKDT